MATKTEVDVEVDGPQGSAEWEKEKKPKRKGKPHPLNWEVLDNPDIKAEQGWEDEEQEYWTSQDCKKFVKMYHIGKLWPRRCHEVNTKASSCMPVTCRDDHFNHRCEEVWRALFGDRVKGKDSFPYILLAMVYTELILKRKVNWSTYQTSKAFPLRISRKQKDIPDCFDPESTLTKNILRFLKKVDKKKKEGGVIIGD